MLRQPAADSRDAAVRWRQLVDLIARGGAAADPELLGEALAVIRRDSARIDEPLRAAAARAISALPVPLGLLETFVADRLSVSAPILAAASLDSNQWRVLLAAADPETRRFIETLHPDIGQLTPAAMPAASDLSIGELVSRIERRRSERSREPAPAQRVRATNSQAGLFLWEAAANGEIDWVDGVPRGAMIGRSIARAGDSAGEHIGDELARAFAARSPFRDQAVVIAGDGPAAGEWLLSGAPAFDPDDGRFRGYRGNARRAPGAAVPAADVIAPPQPELDSDALRELVHELKTPLNAIIGFSEIIDGQFLGPAGRRYRDRATDIAGEARRLLAAIDDLDLAAKTRSSAAERAPTDLANALSQIVESLRKMAEMRGVDVQLAPAGRPVPVAVDAQLLERLVTRLVRAVLDSAGSGERLQLAAESAGRLARVTLTRPGALAGESGGRGNADYPLRLAQGLMRIAGGDVRIGPEVVAADFPAA